MYSESFKLYMFACSWEPPQSYLLFCNKVNLHFVTTFSHDLLQLLKELTALEGEAPYLTYDNALCTYYDVSQPYANKKTDTI